MNGKGVVCDWLRAQESVADENSHGMTWSILTTGPYMDMLYNVSYPLHFVPMKDAEGTM